MGERDRSNKGSLVAGVRYRLPDQVGPVGEAFFLQLQEMFQSQSLVLLRDFNHSDIFWESIMVSCRQSRRLLKCITNNFPSKVIDSPTRVDAILDLFHNNASEHQDWRLRRQQ